MRALKRRRRVQLPLIGIGAFSNSENGEISRGALLGRPDAAGQSQLPIGIAIDCTRLVGPVGLRANLRGIARSRGRL